MHEKDLSHEYDFFGKFIHARNFWLCHVVPPVQTLGVEVGRQKSLIYRFRRASRDRSVRAIFLGGKSRGSVAFGNLRFLYIDLAKPKSGDVFH